MPSLPYHTIPYHAMPCRAMPSAPVTYASPHALRAWLGLPGLATTTAAAAQHRNRRAARCPRRQQLGASLADVGGEGTMLRFPFPPLAVQFVSFFPDKKKDGVWGPGGLGVWGWMDGWMDGWRLRVGNIGPTMLSSMDTRCAQARLGSFAGCRNQS